MYKQFGMLYMIQWVQHNHNACNALKEYASKADYVRVPYNLMKQIAEEYGTTTEEMKEHWRCVKR